MLLVLCFRWLSSEYRLVDLLGSGYFVCWRFRKCRIRLLLWPSSDFLRKCPFCYTAVFKAFRRAEEERAQTFFTIPKMSEDKFGQFLRLHPRQPELVIHKSLDPAVVIRKG